MIINACAYVRINTAKMYVYGYSYMCTHERLNESACVLQSVICMSVCISVYICVLVYLYMCVCLLWSA